MGHRIDETKAGPVEGFEIFRRMVEEFYGVGRGRSSRGGDVWSPQTDVYETESELVIKMAVPGIKAADVRVVFSGNVVTISGYRGPCQEAGVLALHQMEIRTGYFERNVAVNQPCDADGMSWDYTDGILSLRVPKATAPLTRSYMVRLRL